MKSHEEPQDAKSKPKIVGNKSNDQTPNILCIVYTVTFKFMFNPSLPYIPHIQLATKIPPIPTPPSVNPTPPSVICHCSTKFFRLTSLIVF